VARRPFLIGAIGTVILSIPMAIAVCLAMVVLFAVGAGLQLVGTAVARAIDYELADNFHNSPKGGYYDRNGGGYCGTC